MAMATLGTVGYSWYVNLHLSPGGGWGKAGGGLVQARALAWYIPGTYLVH